MKRAIALFCRQGHKKGYVGMCARCVTIRNKQTYRAKVDGSFKPATNKRPPLVCGKGHPRDGKQGRACQKCKKDAYQRWYQANRERLLSEYAAKKAKRYDDTEGRGPLEHDPADRTANSNPT